MGILSPVRPDQQYTPWGRQHLIQNYDYVLVGYCSASQSDLRAVTLLSTLPSYLQVMGTQIQIRYRDDQADTIHAKDIVCFIKHDRSGVSFAKPTLVEIFTEIHLEPGSFLPPQFFDVVPKIKSLGFPDVEMGSVDTFAVTGDSLAANSGELMVQSAPRIRCWSEDHHRLVQLWPDTIAVNLVGKYPGWDDYSRLFCSVHRVVQGTIGNPRVDMLALHTIDELNVPIGGFSVGKYLHCGGKRVPSWYADTTQPFDITLGKGLLKTDGFNRVLKISGRASETTFTIRILSVFQNAATDQSIELLLSDLHDESNESFYSLITPTTESQVLGGVASHARNTA